MEKYSSFKDPLTGINPFIQPKLKKLRLSTVLFAIFRFPLYFLFLLGFPVISSLISIKLKNNKKPKGLTFSNSVTEFDRAVIKKAFGTETSNFQKNGSRLRFPEETNTNGLAILHFKDSDCDSVIGLKYNEECIYMYGNRFSWLLRFLGTANTVEIKVLNNNNLSEAAGVPGSSLDKNDKNRFLQVLQQ